MPKKNERLERAINNWKRNQLSLAEAIGVDRATITQWVHHEVIPMKAHRVKLAEVLGVDVFVEDE